MIDISKTIEPKSDQMNYDDLIAGPKTIEVSAVKVVGGDQPVHICYVGGEGKPWKPCKSMRRVMVKAWGKDGEKYAGRKITLVGDPEVTWGGGEVGGIRISHMSDIKDGFKMMLTKSRGKRSQYPVKPLITKQLIKLSNDDYENLVFEIEGAKTMDELANVGVKIKEAGYDAAGNAKIKAVYKKANDSLRTDIKPSDELL